MKTKKRLSFVIAIVTLLSVLLPVESFAVEECTTCDGRGQVLNGNYYGYCTDCGGSGIEGGDISQRLIYGDGWKRVTPTAPSSISTSVSKPTPSPTPAPSYSTGTITFDSESNASVPGLYLERNVWGEAQNNDVLAVLQSVFEVYTDTYGGDYMARTNLHTVIKQSA